MTPTSRRYPRSLAEAFPRDYADPLDRPPRRILPRWLAATIALAVVAAFAAKFLIGAPT